MFFHKTAMLFLYVCFCHKHEEYNYEYCLFRQCFYPIYIGFFMFDAKELIQNSIPVLTKNIESVLIPCFMLNHIKYIVSMSKMSTLQWISLPCGISFFSTHTLDPLGKLRVSCRNPCRT